MVYRLIALLALCGTAQAQIYYNQTTTSPTQYVSCANVSATDDVLLANAFANAGGIVLQASCTIDTPITVNSNTNFDGNGYTVSGVGNINGFVAAVNASNIVISNTTFSFPSAGAAHKILWFQSGNSNISVVNNVGTGSGDFVAYTTSTNTYTSGNKAYNNTNACYDHWFGSGNNLDIGNFCSMSASGAAEYGMLWTGTDTVGNPATTIHYSAIGNIIVLNIPANANNIGIWLEGKSVCGGGAAADYDVVADNQIILSPGVLGIGVRANGCVNNAVIHDNIITTDGVTASTNHWAVEVLAPATNINVHDNLVYNWINTGAGIFANTGTGGSLQFNHCYGTCTSTTTAIDNTNSTIQQIGDDAGTGLVNTKGTTQADDAPSGYVGQVSLVNCMVGDTAAAPSAVTVTVASPAVVTWPSHTFATSTGLSQYTCPINFLGTPPTGISVGTNYYIIGSSVSGDTFQISTSALGGLNNTGAVNTTGVDGGTTAYIGNLGASNTVFAGAALNLSPGDWDCSFLAEYQELIGLTTTKFTAGVHTSIAVPTVGNQTSTPSASQNIGVLSYYLGSPIVRENISSTTSTFGIDLATFSAGTMNDGGLLRCRRMR